jgi:hypothetical protein
MVCTNYGRKLKHKFNQIPAYPDAKSDFNIVYLQTSNLKNLLELYRKVLPDHLINQE